MLLGLLLAIVATTCDNLGVVVQAAEARKAPPELALRAGLIVRLAHQRAWLLGGVLLVAGVVLQTAALTRAPLTLVQPAIGLGLFVLVVASARVLGQRIGLVQVAAVTLLAGAIAGVTLLGPRAVHKIPSAPALGLVTAVAAAVAAVPYVIHARSRRTVGAVPLAVGAGAAYAAVAILLKGLADSFVREDWVAIPIICGALALLGGAGFLLEQTALSTGLPTTVDPIIMLFQIGGPVLVALTLLGEPRPHGLEAFAFMACLVAAVLGAVALARAPGVAAARAESSRSARDRPAP